MLKPDQGGSGARIQVVESLEQVDEIFRRDPSYWLPDNLFLLQEYLPHDPEQGIVRLEFLGGELLYAMRVKTHGRFNLCPSPVCNPDDGDGVCEVPAQEVAAPPVEFFPYPEVPDEAVATASRIVAAARLDVGGIEYLETPDGRRVFYDINANSNLRPSVAQAFGFDPFERVVDFLQAQIASMLSQTRTLQDGAAMQRHAAKSCPGRPRRIGKAVGASHRLPWVCLISWPVAQLTSRLRPLRSNRCDESVDEALRAATKSSKPRRLATMRRGLPGHDFAETWLVLVVGAPTMLARGRRYPAGAISVAAAMLGLGSGALGALRKLTRRTCLNGAAFRARSELCDADPRPSIAAESERSGDRHSMSPRRVPPAATRGLAATGIGRGRPAEQTQAHAPMNGRRERPPGS